MKFISMEKKKNKINSKQQTAQRQKMKMLMRTGAAVLLLLILGITIFIHVTNSDRSTAGTEGNNGWTIVKDPEYVNEMSLEAPVITHTPIAKSTIQCRVPKAENTNQ
jgi:hypothetical protein